LVEAGGGDTTGPRGLKNILRNKKNTLKSLQKNTNPTNVHSSSKAAEIKIMF
jgi:hypothetical protein